MRHRLFWLTIFVGWLLSGPLHAEELQATIWRGHPALRLTGIIESGTAERFISAISAIAPSDHGARILLLDSPGGSVEEAFAMSRAMDKIKIHTVIPDGARCASACASIVFIAGEYRTVEVFGLFGQHSCSSNGVANQACNDEISNHAFAHGVSYGSVSAFITYVGPDDILWLSRTEADGWGLTRYPGEEESGFSKSEPYAFRYIFNKRSPAQAAWRIDFREDGYRAFLRPYSDEDRELQINLFCDESLKGRLFLTMEIHGPAHTVSDAVLDMRVATDIFDWNDERPVIWQADDLVAEVITEIPQDRIKDFLSAANTLRVTITTRPPYDLIEATTYLKGSRKVLIFAANHCVTGHYDGPRAPLL